MSTKKTAQKSTTTTKLEKKEQAQAPVPPVRFRVPYECARGEIERLYGVNRQDTNGILMALLVELVWARLQREANNGN